MKEVSLGMRKIKKIMFAVIPIVVAILGLMLANTSNSASQEVTLDKVLLEPDKYKEKLITLQGDLMEDSIHWDADKTELSFDIKKDDHTIKVQYKGVKPDTFSDGTIVMADGVYDIDEQVLHAERLRTRCPSKYEASEKDAVAKANYDPKTHNKKE